MSPLVEKQKQASALHRRRNLSPQGKRFESLWCRFCHKAEAKGCCLLPAPQTPASLFCSGEREATHPTTASIGG